MPPKKKKNKSLASYKGKENERKSGASPDDGEDGKIRLTFPRAFRGKHVENWADLGNRLGMHRECLAEMLTALTVSGGAVPEEMRSKYLEKCINQFEEVPIPNDGPDSECIFFSGQTKFRATDLRTNKETSAKAMQHHISLVGEPGGRFLGHAAPDNEKDAEEVANEMWALMEEKRLHQDMLIIGGEPRRVNTDPEQGVFHRIQEKKGHRLTVAVCMLESLRNILRNFIRSRLISPAIVHYLEICKEAFPDTPRPYNPDFDPIPAEGVFFPEGPVSSQERFLDEEDYAHMIWPVITRKGDIGQSCSGEPDFVPTTFEEFLEFGPGYWDEDLKEANAFLRLYIHKYKLSRKDARNLKDIVRFIIYFFYPTWFRVRGNKTKLVDAPTFILEELKSIRNHVPGEIKEEVKAVVETESWMAHPEILLLHMLAADDAEMRKFAVDQILCLRGSEQFGDTANRPFLPPKLNWDAETVKDIIDWKKTVITEPIQTAKLSTEEIKKLLDSPMTLRLFTCHGKSLSKIKNEMKNACEEVIGMAVRDELVHRRCDPKILMARNPNELASDESDSDYDEEMWTDTRKKRDDDDQDKFGKALKRSSNLPQLCMD